MSRQLVFDIVFKGNANALKNINENVDKLKEKAVGAGAKLDDLGKKAGTLGKSMTTKITLPIVAGIGASINEFAKLEQSIGGVETLFKGSASEVIKNSETAFKRAGVSANDYMESVTSFSASLLQGLGGDTKKAVKVADTAMVDMSDNANKFGTDIGAIQNAYQGFAKDNFTMLDNLKLGYGGTAGEMARLINDSGVMGKSFKATADNVKDIGFDKMIEAIHNVQSNMGVTGTTSKEAMETVAGSIGMAKASLQDFLGGLGNSNADVGQLTKNMVESFKAVVKNIKGVLSTMWDNIPLAGWQKNIIVVVTAMGPLLLVISKTILAVSKAILFFGKLKTAFIVVKGAVMAVAGALSWPVVIIGALIAAGILLYKNWDLVKEKAGQLKDWLVEKFSALKEGVVNKFNEIKEGTVNKVNEIKQSIIDKFSDIKQGIIDKINGVKTSIENVFSNIYESMMTPFNNIRDGISNIFTGIVNIFTGGWEIIKNIFIGSMLVILDLVTLDFQNLGSHITQIWGNIKDGFSLIWEGITQVFSGYLEVIRGVSQVVWESIKATAIGAWNTLKESVSSILSATVEWIKGTWNGLLAWFSTLPARLLAIGVNMMTSLRNGIASLAGAVMSKAREIGQSVVNAVKQIPSQMLTIGKNIIQGLIRGITGSMGALKAKATEIANSVKSTFTGLLGIKSPSRVFMEYGNNIGQGLEIGMNKQSQNLINATKDMSSDVSISKYINDDISNSERDYENAPTQQQSYNNTQTTSNNSIGDFNPTINITVQGDSINARQLAKDLESEFDVLMKRYVKKLQMRNPIGEV